MIGDVTPDRTTPPALEIGGLDAAMRALLLIGGRSGISLISPPDGAVILGGGFWAALTRAIAPGAGDRPAMILDCGDRAGPALDALAAGCADLLCAAPGADLRAFALAAGARIYTRRGPSLAITARQPSDRAVEAFLCQVA